MIQCDTCNKIYSKTEYKSCPSCKFDAVGRENTQALVQKDLLLEWDADKNKRECIVNGEMTCKCENCHTIYEYYPEDPYPLDDGEWCYTCLFGKDEYDDD